MAIALGASAIAFLAWRAFSTPTVTVTEVVEGPVVQAFYATGTLLPDREYPIKSNVEGIVTEVVVDKGSPVKAGQKVAFVRVEEYVMRFSQAQAELELKKKLAQDETSPTLLEYDTKLEAANEQLRIAQRELERVKNAMTRSGATQADLDRSADRVQLVWSLVESIKAQKGTRKMELERDVTVAQAAFDIAQWNLSEQTIKSPVDGVVLDRPVSIGTRVPVNGHLMLVADVAPDKLVMRAAVDEEDKTRLVLDQRVNMTLYSYPGRVFEGRAKKIYPKADPDRRTFEVDVAVDPIDPSFAAGMTGELAFVVEAKDRAMVVPSQAMQGGAVWIVRDGTLLKSDATIGLRSVERTEIVSGLSPGDRVVISPVGNLAEGQNVRTTFMDAITAAGLNKPAHEEKAFKGFN